MNELISYEPGIVGESCAVSFVKCVKLNLVDASKAFFEIGFRLKEAQENKYFEELGFDNLVDCAEYHFNFKKTTTYELIKIYEKFHREDAPMRIIEGLENFNQSQLSVMASYVPDEWTGRFKRYLSLFSPADTVRKIKYASDCFKAVHNLNCCHIPFDVIQGCKTADELIKNVQEYALNNFKWTKANYPKVITSELESKYYALEKAPVDNGDTLKPDVEIAHESAVAEEISISAPQNEFADVIELEEVQSDVRFSAPEEEDEAEIEDELKMSDYLQKEIYKSFCRMISELLTSSKYDGCVRLVGHNYTNFVKDLYSLISKFIFLRKSDIKMVLENEYKGFDYDINLHGRKQNLKVFISNIVNSFSQFFEPLKERKND